MRPLSRERPKAVLPTLDLPNLGWALARVARAGIERVWVNAHFHAAAIEETARDYGERLGLQVEISYEDRGPLGTAGALKKISANLTEPIVLLSADVLTDLPIERVIEAHASSGGAATLAVIPTSDNADMLIEEGWVTELIDRQDRSRPGYIYANLGVFETEVLNYIPDGASGLFETVMVGLDSAGKGMAAVEWDGYFIDVGTPQDHLRSNLDALAEGETKGGLSPNTPQRHDHLAFVGAGARVEDVELRHVIVGSNAAIAPGSSLQRCVVWDGAEVREGDYADSVITPKRVVRAS